MSDCNAPNPLDQPSVQEAGHATMAVVQKRPCKGIFVELAEGGLVLWRCLTEDVGLTRETYLIDAAGAAAESLILGKVITEPVHDKKDFSLPDAPSWDATIAEAKTILTPHIDAIRRIAVAIQRVRETTPLMSLPEVVIDKVKYRQVLSTEDINRAFDAEAETARVVSCGGSVLEYKYRYNWQSDTQLGFNSPLIVGMKFADLKTGRVYQVQSIGVAGPLERVGLNPPENVVRTTDAGQLSPEELENMCQKYEFEDSPLALPRQEFGMLGSSTKRVTASLKGIDETKGTYQVQWMLILYEGKIVSQGFSARNYGEVPDGNYEIEYSFEGRTINKRITIVRDRRVSNRQSFTS
jgi:hypothetical protein